MKPKLLIVSCHRILLMMAILMVLTLRNNAEAETINKKYVLVPPVQLVLATNSTQVPIVNSVTVTISVHNLSSQPLAFPSTSGTVDYNLIVLDSDGKPLSLSLQGQLALLSGSSRRIKRVLSAGQILTEDLYLDKMYDFPHPGKYTIIATRDFEVASIPYTFRAVSNALTVNVKAEKPSSKK